MKYVVLIYSNPQPWGHPSGDYIAENLALPKEQREQMNKRFESMFEELQASGELVGGEALADPATSRLYRWRQGQPVATDGPYSETKEHLAGFFLLDVATEERAAEVATVFSGPGETVEIRPGWTG